MDREGLLLYRYRGTDRAHRENEGLRAAMREKVPLVYLYGVAAGWYVAEWPVFVVGDDPGRLTFQVAVGDQQAILSGPIDLATLELETDAARRYATRTALVRLHQQSFRIKVLRAYREQCAICRRRGHPPRRSPARRADRAERPRAVHAAPRRVRPPRARRATRPRGADPARCPRGGGRPDAGAWPPGLPRRRRRRAARGVAAAAEGIFGGTVRALPEGVVETASPDRTITRVTASIPAGGEDA